MTERRLLHIYSQPNPEAERIESALAQVGIGVLRAEDCFAGMAQLVRGGPGAFEALLVCLNGLTREDEEFFQIASRRYRQSPIYLYGASTHQLKLVANKDMCLCVSRFMRSLVIPGDAVAGHPPNGEASPIDPTVVRLSHRDLCGSVR